MLISILLPVLGKARDPARCAQELSNLRQLGIACTAYASENKGLYPIGAAEDTGTVFLDNGGMWDMLARQFKIKSEMGSCYSVAEMWGAGRIRASVRRLGSRIRTSITGERGKTANRFIHRRRQTSRSTCNGAGCTGVADRT